MARIVGILFATLLIVFLISESVAARSWQDSWATVINERHGFAIAYPDNIFEQQKEALKTDEGGVYVSKDGKAKLLVSAFENVDNQSLQD